MKTKETKDGRMAIEVKSYIATLVNLIFGSFRELLMKTWQHKTDNINEEKRRG